MILTVDFGSTFTKLVAIDSEAAKVVGTAKAFTTITTDIRDGFNAALAELRAQTGVGDFSHMLAASSAGGGLKMVAVGLVPGLTAKAASMAACSAGAKVVKTFAYELSPAEVQEIYDINPDLILLSGGTDGGNKEVILHNARKLADIDREFAVIVAGNKSVAGEVDVIFEKSGKRAVVCGNVMPAFNTLEIAPAKDAIRRLFMEKIIEAKGLGEAAKLMSMPIIPTPLAVFEAAQVLAESIGPLMAVDVGGATTDVYSMCDGAPTLPNVVQKGLPEPFAKRTVEGDLGMRYSLDGILEYANNDMSLESVIVGADLVSARASDDSTVMEQPYDCTCDKLCGQTQGLPLQCYLAICKKDPSYIPDKNTPHAHLDQTLCAIAVAEATQRHAGKLETAYTPYGQAFYQLGKDLSDVKYVLGLGGPIIYSPDPTAILANAIANTNLNDFRDSYQNEYLRPKSPKYLLDKDYIFAAMGLLSRINKGIAQKILSHHITEV